MKIAIPFEKGEVFAHFGKTPAFLIAEVEKGQLLNPTVVETAGAGHGALAGFLQRHQVQCCLCLNLGQGAYNALSAAGIQVIRGVGGDALQQAQRFAQGEISDDPTAVCSHHEHHEGHSCHCSK